MDKQILKMYRLTIRQKDGYIDKKIYRDIDRQKIRQKDRQTDIQIDRYIKEVIKIQEILILN